MIVKLGMLFEMLVSVLKMFPTSRKSYRLIPREFLYLKINPICFANLSYANYKSITKLESVFWKD